MNLVNIGQSITINARRAEKMLVTREEFTVYQMYHKFCVLDNGKYKVCAYYDDLKQKMPIVI